MSLKRLSSPEGECCRRVEIKDENFILAGPQPRSGTVQPLLLAPSWFAIVMGLAGLGLAWNGAVPLMGEYAGLAAQGIGIVAVSCFIVLLGLSLLRQQRHPEALLEDLRHPVRHAFVAAVPISLVLLVTLGTALFGPTTTGLVLWTLACIGQLAVTVWVLARWWRGNGAGGLQWVGITPILIIPVVGNVLTPLAGMVLGQPAWAAAQFGLGAFLWPLIIVLLFVRIATQGLWPERLLPPGFITIAPPAVIGLSLLQLGTAEPWAQACWGVARHALRFIFMLNYRYDVIAPAPLARALAPIVSGAGVVIVHREAVSDKTEKGNPKFSIA